MSQLPRTNDVNEVISNIERGIWNDKTRIMFKYGSSWYETNCGRIRILDVSGILVNYDLDKSGVKRLLIEISANNTPEEASRIISKLTELFFHKATMSGLSLCIGDMKKSDYQNQLLEDAKIKANSVEDPMERAKIWDDAINKATDDWVANNDESNSIMVMMQSGARVTPTQVRQMIIAKGLLTSMDGGLMCDAVPASLAEGLGTIDYFKTTGPARRGLAGNHFIVPASGYLERQLVAVARELTIVGDDCRSTDLVECNKSDARGRFTCDPTDPSYVYVVDERNCSDKVMVRSPITCKQKYGLCKVCVGLNPTNSKKFRYGVGIGVMSAQTLVEPASQLGLRGKHTSGSVTLASYSNKIENSLAQIIKAVGAQGTQDIKVGECDGYSPDSIPGDSYVERAVNLSNYIKSVYAAAGVKIARFHIEVIVRAISDVQITPHGVVVRSRSPEIEIPDISIMGCSYSLTKYPSWFKRCGFGKVSSSITEAVINNTPTMDLPTELLMQGSVTTGIKITKGK